MPPIFEWNEDLILGNETIDEHHRHLVELLNSAHESFIYGMRQGGLKRMVAELVAYTDYHFAAEEAIMQDHQYPDRDAHIQEHETFRQKAMEMHEKYRKDHLPAYLEITVFLLEWLFAHINVTDRSVFEYLAVQNSS